VILKSRVKRSWVNCFYKQLPNFKKVSQSEMPVGCETSWPRSRNLFLGRNLIETEEKVERVALPYGPIDVECGEAYSILLGYSVREPC
jgi:hypothetical protein